MQKKNNWQQFEQVLKDNRITKLYHFTDFDNLESIIQNGGLYSWADCDEKGIKIAKPGGSALCETEFCKRPSHAICSHERWAYLKPCGAGD